MVMDLLRGFGTVRARLDLALLIAVLRHNLGQLIPIAVTPVAILFSAAAHCRAVRTEQDSRERRRLRTGRRQRRCRRRRRGGGGRRTRTAERAAVDCGRRCRRSSAAGEMRREDVEGGRFKL